MKRTTIIRVVQVLLLLCLTYAIFGQKSYDGYMVHEDYESAIECDVVTIGMLVVFTCEDSVYSFYRVDDLKFTANFVKYSAFLDVFNGDQMVVLYTQKNKWLFVVNLDSVAEISTSKI